ncbi:MAG TPA: D-2-hydroxyacid dehydrogenase [Jatrophihabitans sp.]|nr:D-2-hydroxyacid dehydrogenase [Jatrophihabitans sp.]
MNDELNVLIATYLEPELVERIASSDPRLRVLYEPDLLPVPRYRCDHGGQPRTLSQAEQQRWQAMLAAADVSFDFDWQEPARLPERAPRLRWVQATSAGIGAFMRRTGLHEHELTVTTAAGIHAVPLAEFAVAGALYFIKGFEQLRRRQAAKQWQRYTTEQLAGRSVTVIGLGGMGSRTAAHFAALGARVTGLGRPGGQYNLPDGVTVRSTEELSEVLPATDVLVLCCALTPQTEGMIGAAQLAALPAGAILINLSRGQVVDEPALIEALAAGRLAGACLDVFTVEPLPADSPLWELDNVIISPHSASTVDTENAALTELFLQNLQAWRAGQPLRNTYRRELGY